MPGKKEVWAKIPWSLSSNIFSPAYLLLAEACRKPEGKRTCVMQSVDQSLGRAGPGNIDMDLR